MKASQVDPRPRYQCRQASHEFHWTEHYMGGAVIIGRLEGDIAILLRKAGLHLLR